MQPFLAKNYTAVLLLLLGLLIGVTYYAGFLEGKSSALNPVIFSCTDATLQTLKVPLSTIASGKQQPRIEGTDFTASATPQGKYVGSKNGTKYYLPTCATAKRIKLENRVWFKDAEDATLQGYIPGKC